MPKRYNNKNGHVHYYQDLRRVKLEQNTF